MPSAELGVRGSGVAHIVNRIVLKALDFAESCASQG
jgi:hypothetical protein